jgi:hypothetical protein
VNADRTIFSATPDRPDTKLTAVFRVSFTELEQRPQPPSQTIREHEARLIADLARNAHLDGRRFEGWPQLSAVQTAYMGMPDRSLDLRAEVNTRSIR